ncbi:MAG: hybrid sensor histidine kinase/response regulator [Hydrococcus sp. C42_A2020_068]|nr:hybrid sensor histidine kinase/response regulator [Hydrococcus sp. C42_A2020_068]
MRRIPEVSQSARKDKILVVDDSPENLLLVESILQQEGYEIFPAKDGWTALALVKQFVPHLILLDVMMPGMDGFEVTRRIREDPSLPYIPILLITVHDRPSAVKGLDMGADDFIRKPVDVDELLARVRSLLRLKHSLDRQEQMVKVREDYMSRLAHDLRAPLFAAERVLGLLQQGAFGDLSPSVLEAIAILARSNRNLLEMVNTLLEVYRYEFAQKALDFVRVDLGTLAEEVVRELTPLANEKGLSLTLELDSKDRSPSNLQVLGDRLELRRLLTNLIDNSIKFTDCGSVRVRLYQSPKRSNSDEVAKAWALVTVEDTGPGISAQEQQFLFDRYRVGKHRRSGSGLGLHLSRQIVETHQGTIEVSSEPGRGSIFIVRLPAIT